MRSPSDIFQLTCQKFYFAYLRIDIHTISYNRIQIHVILEYLNVRILGAKSCIREY